MTNLEIIFLMSVVFLLYIFGLYFNKQYNLNIIGWINVSSKTPFTRQIEAKLTSSGADQKIAEIRGLEARIAVLEK